MLIFGGDRYPYREPIGAVQKTAVYHENNSSILPDNYQAQVGLNLVKGYRFKLQGFVFYIHKTYLHAHMYT